MDCSQDQRTPPANSKVNENPSKNDDILDENGDTTQETSIQQTVEKLLTKYRKDLDDFAKTINVYASSSTALVETKLDELSDLCFREIEDRIRQGQKWPKLQYRTHICNSIQQANDDLNRSIESSQRDYNSCLDSLNQKLKNATAESVRQIVNWGATSNPGKISSAVLRKNARTIKLQPTEVIQTMLEEDSKNFRASMNLLEEALTDYRRAVTTGFETHRFVSSQQLWDSHERAQTDAQAKLIPSSSFFSAHLADGINRIFDVFASMNKLITKHEKTLITEMSENDIRIFQCYNNLMKQKYDSYCAETSDRLESSVSGGCVDDNKIESTHRPLSTPKKSTSSERNTRKSDRFLSSVSWAINDNKRTYNYKMEECLKKTGGSMGSQEFERHHVAILTEVCNSLEFELQKMEGLVEATSHVTTLKKEIEADWADFKAKNENEPIDVKEFEIEKKKTTEEAVMKQKVQAEERQQREQKSTAKGSVPHPSVVTPSPITPPTIQSTPSLRASTSAETAPAKKTLKPIAIEFGLRFIRVGWVEPVRKKFVLLKNEWDEEATPSVVALSKDGEILVGSEVTTRVRSDLRWMYSMSQIILEEEKPFISFGYDVGGIQEARKELLMGHMLSKVKKGVEKRLNGSWETVVLTVPLWYSSVHRQATRDAATIAGFKSIHLINETSAAAISHANFTTNKPNENEVILVAVCSDSYFDAAVYTVKGVQLRMESSCGSRHLPNLQPRNSILSSSSSFAFSLAEGAGARNFVLAKEGKTEVEVERSVKEMIGELSKYIRACVCVNTNPDANSFYKEIAPLLIRCCKSNSSSIFQAGDVLNIVEGAADVASRLDQHNESRFSGQDQILMQNIVQDKLTYSFELSHSFDRKPRRFVEHKSPLVNAKGEPLAQDITLITSSCKGTRVTITEGSIYVGSLTVVQPPEKGVRLKGIISNEGILRIELFAGTKHNLEPVEFTWSSHNLKTKEIQDLAAHVTSLQGDCEEKKLLEQTKQQLNDILKDMRPNLNNLEGIKKAIVTKSVDEAAATVDHSSSTIVMMQNKIEQLVALRSKYSI